MARKRRCNNCQDMFTGRKDAKTCSDRCRKSYHRARQALANKAEQFKDSIRAKTIEVEHILSPGPTLVPVTVGGSANGTDDYYDDSPEFIETEPEPSQPKPSTGSFSLASAFESAAASPSRAANPGKIYSPEPLKTDQAADQAEDQFSYKPAEPKPTPTTPIVHKATSGDPDDQPPRNRRLLYALPLVLLLFFAGLAGFGWYGLKNDQTALQNSNAAEIKRLGDEQARLAEQNRQKFTTAELKVDNDAVVGNNLDVGQDAAIGNDLNVDETTTTKNLIVLENSNLRGSLNGTSASFANVQAENFSGDFQGSFRGDFSGTGNGSFSGDFSGDGSGLSNVDAAKLNGQNGTFYRNANNINAGTLSDNRLSTNVALLNRSGQTFTGANTFLQGQTLQGGLNVSGPDPIVATFDGRVVGDEAVNTDEFVTLGQLTTVSAGNFFIQGGNSFGTTAVLGTNDNQNLALETNGISRLVIDTSGNANLTGSFTAAGFSGNGSALSNVDAVTLQGQNGGFYRNANNINAGTLADSRLSTNVTLQGNSFNGGSQLVQLTAGGLLPALNGSNLTNVDALTLQGFSAGNASGNLALNNGTLNTNLNADLLDGLDSTAFASASGSGNYIQNGTALQTANFNISGNGFFGGNVGIGTTTPTNAKLEIVNSASETAIYVGSNVARTAPGIRLIGYSSDNINGGGGLELGDGLGVSLKLFRMNSNDFKLTTVGSGGGKFIIMPSNGVGGFQVQDNAANPVLTADTLNKRVGIGTTAPAYKLDVVGTAGIRDTLTINSVNVPANITDATGSNITLKSGNTNVHLNQANGFISSTVQGSEVMRLTNTGNVGIGTTAPAYKLDVQGGIGIVGQFSGRVIGGNAVNTNEFTTLGQVNSLGAGNYIQNGTGLQATANFNIQSAAAGSIGGVIRGAVSQTADLLQFQNSAGTVLGGLNNNARLYYGNSGFTGLIDQGTLTGNQVYTLPGDRSGTFCLTSGNCAGVGGTGDILNNGQNGPITIGSNDATALTLETTNTPRITILSGGNVGIGTATPGFKLDIRDNNTGVAGFRVTNATNGAGAQIQNLLVNNAGSFAYYGITASGYTRYSLINGGRAFYGSYLTDTVIFTQSSKDIIFGTNGVEAARILSDGNVGIGTAAPTSALQLGSDAGTAASGIKFGSTGDTNLYRSAADTLKTDDSFEVGANLNVSGASTLASLTVTGAATFQGALTVVGNATFNGDITFSANTRGKNEAVASSATTLVISGKTYPDASYAVNCTPNYDTTCFVTGKSATGFTLNFGTAAPAGATVDWIVIR